MTHKNLSKYVFKHKKQYAWFYLQVWIRDTAATLGRQVNVSKNYRNRLKIKKNCLFELKAGQKQRQRVRVLECVQLQLFFNREVSTERAHPKIKSSPCETTSSLNSASFKMPLKLHKGRMREYSTHNIGIT